MKLSAHVDAVARRLSTAGLAYGQGTLDADDEAAWLVLAALGLPLDAFDDEADREVDASGAAAIDALARRRIDERLPMAYLTGETWLQGVPFFVDSRSIVPRSFIAEALAEATIDPFLHPATSRVLDLCTGNGSLAVLAALAWPDVRVTGADLSADALALAARNADRHGLGRRLTLKQGDGLAAVDGETFDLILCNPPYVPHASMQALPPEFRAEPALALDGGADGMDFIRPLLARAAEHLTPWGVLVLEVGQERAAFEAAFPRLEPVWLPTSAEFDPLLLLTREQLVARR